MKSRIQYILVMFIALRGAYLLAPTEAVGQPSLTLDSVVGEQNGSAALHLRIDGGIDPYAGVNAKIQLPMGVNLTSASSGALLSGGFRVDFEPAPEGSAIASVIAYSDSATFSANSGVLLNLNLSISPDAPLGNQDVGFFAEMTGISNETGTMSVAHVRANGSIEIVEEGQGGEGEGEGGGEGEGESGEGESGGGGEGEGESGEGGEGEVSDTTPPSCDLALSGLVVDVDTPIDLTLTAHDDASATIEVSITINGNMISPVQDQGNGVWTARFTPTAGGIFEARANVTDEEGNDNFASAVFRVLEDAGEGEMELEGDGEGDGNDLGPGVDVDVDPELLTTGGMVSIGVMAFDVEGLVDSVDVTVNGEPFAVNDNGDDTWSGNFDDASVPGIYQVVSEATDDDGNSSRSYASFLFLSPSPGEGEGEGEGEPQGGDEGAMYLPQTHLAAGLSDLKYLRTIRDSAWMTRVGGGTIARQYYSHQSEEAVRSLSGKADAVGVARTWIYGPTLLLVENCVLFPVMLTFLLACFFALPRLRGSRFRR